jgi:hypothetical protein
VVEPCSHGLRKVPHPLELSIVTSRHRTAMPVPARFVALVALVLTSALLAWSTMALAPVAPGARAAAGGPGSDTTEAARAAEPGDRALAPCRMKPNDSNTGAKGELRASGRTVLGDGATLRNARVSNLTISGTGVVVRNVRVEGTVLITGERVRLKRVTAGHIGISSAVDVVVDRANIGFGPDDGIHVTSDGDRLVRDVVLRYNYIHHPAAPPESHYDGTQVRGVDGMTIRCSTYRSGPFQETMNANIYLENANGGVRNVTVARNWLYGSAWSVMVSAESARLVGNRLGGKPHWGFCYLSSGRESIATEGNVRVPGRRPVNLCGKG